MSVDHGFALQVALIAIRMTKIPTFQTNIKFKCKALRTETGDCRHLMKKIKFKYGTQGMSIQSQMTNT